MASWFAHAIKPNHSTEGPSELLAVSLSTQAVPTGGREAPVAHYFLSGVVQAVRMVRGQATRCASCEFTAPEQFWEFLTGRLHPRRPVWIFAFDLLNTWRLLGGFAVIEANNPHRWRCVLADRVTILRGPLPQGSLRAVDVANYFPLPIEELAASFGVPVAPVPPEGALPAERSARDTSVCQALLAAFAGLLTECRQRDLGVWSVTAGSLAWRAWRHGRMPCRVYPHKNLAALGLERGCVSAGRISAYQLGAINGPVYHVDANSLYAHVMRTNLYPRRLERYVVRPSVEWLGRALENWCCCARVWLDTEEARYPVRVPDRLRGERRAPDPDWTWPAAVAPRQVLYPTGVFATYLCGEELRHALVNGHVLRVDSAALYEPADLFSRYVSDLWDMRCANRANRALAVLSKILLVSLWGKFAQRAPDRVCAPGVLPPEGQAWCKWLRYDWELDQNFECQAIAGVCYEEAKGDGSWDSFPAIAAHVCANGRHYLERVKTRVGAGHYFWQHTDALIVDRAGYQALKQAGWINQEELGKFKLVGEHHEAQVLGPTHYVLDGVRTLAGLDRGAVLTGPATVRSRRVDRLDACFSARGRAPVHDVIHVGRLPAASACGLVGPDGWVTPYRLDQHFSSQFSDGPLATPDRTSLAPLRSKDP